jgi:hypothetical protein
MRMIRVSVLYTRMFFGRVSYLASMRTLDRIFDQLRSALDPQYLHDSVLGNATVPGFKFRNVSEMICACRS